MQMLMTIAALFSSEPFINLNTAMIEAQIHIVQALRYRDLGESKGIDICRQELSDDLVDLEARGKIPQNKYRQAVQRQLFELSFGSTGLINLLPRVSDPDEALLDVRRIFYWNCGRLDPNCPLDTLIQAFDASLTVKKIDSFKQFLGRRTDMTSASTDEVPNVDTLSIQEDGICYDSPVCLNLADPATDYSKFVFPKLRAKGRHYFKCQLSDKRSILMVAIVCAENKVALIVIDPANAEITVHSEAWLYIQFLKEHIVNSAIFSPFSLPLSLRNFGHTCYANSALQCLLTMNHFIDDLRNRELFKPETPCWHLQLLIRFCYTARRHGIQILRPTSLCDISKLIFAVQRQQSVDEFLDGLLGRMFFPDKNTRDLPYDVLSEDIAHDLLSHFQVKCNEEYSRQGTILKEKKQPLAFPSISILGTEKSLYDCLNNHFGKEMMERFITYADAAEKIKKDVYTDVLKRTIITETQKYIIFSLKRTGYDSTTSLSIKHNNSIAFPLDRLSLSKYMKDPSCLATYRLRGVIMHRGDAENGHYIAFVLHSDSHWYCCNDSHITIQDELLNNVSTEGHYLDFTPVTFFYECEQEEVIHTEESSAAAAAPAGALLLAAVAASEVDGPSAVSIIRSAAPVVSAQTSAAVAAIPHSVTSISALPFPLPVTPLLVAVPASEVDMQPELSVTSAPRSTGSTSDLALDASTTSASLSVLNASEAVVETSLPANPSTPHSEPSYPDAATSIVSPTPSTPPASLAPSPMPLQSPTSEGEPEQV